jgi:small subunit ribosomal protein S2
MKPTLQISQVLVSIDAVIAVCDTDCDPTLVQYPIPANDDSLNGLQLIAETLGHACKEGHEIYKES